MGDFFKFALEMGQGFITGLGSFWNWFINPIFTIDLTWINADLEVITIAPWMVLSFATLMLLFVISLWHQLNPLG